MKKTVVFMCFILTLLIPGAVLALGFEIAAGTWSQNPSGDISYNWSNANDTIDIEDDLGFSSKWDLFGRIKIDMPLLIPNIYIMATPMKYEATGRKDVNFTFGDQTFTAGTDIDSKLRLTHYDFALYYGIPFVKTATADMLNIDLGINLRLVDLKAEISQGSISESKSLFLPVPMVFAAAQLTPADRFAIEAELRGIAYGGNSYFSAIGRLKVMLFGPVFAGGGYRYDSISVDSGGLSVDTRFAGPFLEAGCEF